MAPLAMYRIVNPATNAARLRRIRPRTANGSDVPALLESGRTDHARDDARIVGRQFDGARAENDHQRPDHAQNQHQSAGHRPCGSRLDDRQSPLENAFGGFAHPIDHQSKMAALGRENRLAGIVHQRKHHQIHIMVLAYDHRCPERRKPVAMAVFDQNPAPQVQLGNGADMRIDADEKRLGSVLPLPEVRLEFNAFDEIRRRIGGVHENIRQRHPRRVALARRGRAAGLELRHDVNAGHKDRQEQKHARNEQDARGLHNECEAAGASRASVSDAERFELRVEVWNGG